MKVIELDLTSEASKVLKKVALDLDGDKGVEFLSKIKKSN
jgi:hypothetical protein